MTIRERYGLRTLRDDIPAELYERIETARKERGVSRRQFIIQALTRHLTAEDNKPKP